MSTRTPTTSDRNTNSPEMICALRERVMDDRLEGAEDHEHKTTHGFDEAQLDDGDPCTVVRRP